MNEKAEPAFHLFFIGRTRRDLSVALLLFLGSAAALYLGTSRWPDTPDGLFHLQRVRALSQALRAGVLFPRWFPDFAFEYGHPILNYYAPAFYYPPALLHLAGAGVITATRITLAVVFGISGVAMYSLLRLWVNVPAALAGAVVYLAFPYRLYDLFIRGAFPEFAAFLWLPLLVLGVVLVARTVRTDAVQVFGPPTPNPGGDLLRDAQAGRASVPPKVGGGGGLPATPVAVVVLTSLAWAGLILTHNLTALMAALGLGVVLVLIVLPATSGDDHANPIVIRSPRIAMAGRVFAWGLIPILLGLLLTAWYVLPALWESSWVGIGADPAASGYLNHFATWQKLFARSAFYAYPSAAEPTVPLPGWVLLLVVAGVIALPHVWKKPLTLPLTIGLVLTAGALWLTTQSSALLWLVAEPVLGKLQFPWRWQSIVALGVAMLAGVLVQVTSDALRRRSRYQHDGLGNPVSPNEDDRLANEARPANSRTYDWPAWLLSALTIGFVTFFAILGLDYAEAPYTDADITAQQMWAFDAEYGQIGMTWTGEFLPRWVEEQRWAIGREPSDGSSARGMPAAKMVVQPRGFGYFDAAYDVRAAEATTLTWHRFYFPAWHVSIDGQRANTVANGNLGQLSVDLPAGEHVVELRWMPTPSVWAGRLLALLAWAALLAALLFAGSRRRWLVGWAALGMIVLTAMVLPLERELAPTLVGADYGPVRLEAASIGSASPGQVAHTTLNWLVVEPSRPLTAFVHVVDEGGNIVAQHDAPLAGDYTPSERWLPGLLIDHTLEVALPDDLHAGDYRVMAGVYEPGNAGSPFAPAGQDDPRVDIGTLAVHP